jgi:hypothetical protein
MANPTQIHKASLGLHFFWGVFAFTLFGALVIVWFRLAAPQQSYDDKRKAQRLEKLKALQLEDQKKLTSYAWADKSKGVVRIPVAEAMKVALLELRSKPVQASAVKAEPPPLNTPLQQAAAPAAAPAASPAASPGASPTAASPEVKK